MKVSTLDYLYLTIGLLVIARAIYVCLKRALEQDKSGKTYFQRNRRNDNVFKYIWRKHYREGTLVVALLISFFIVFADKLFDIPSISAKDELSALLLLFTAAIVFWYTRETYDLKQTSQDSKKIQQKQYDYETLPFLRMQWSDNPTEVFHIKNEGRGIAVDVAFETFDIQRTPRIPVVIKKRPALSPNGWSAVKEAELKEPSEVLDSMNMRGFIDTKLTRGEFKTIKVSYEDLRKRIFDVEFIPDESYNDRFKISYKGERKKQQ